MSIWSKINDKKQQLVSNARSKVKEYKDDRAEEKKLYKATYKEAKRDAIKQKALIKADKIRTNAIKDAQEGGKVWRAVKQGGRALKKHKEAKAKANKGKQTQRRSFRI